MKRQEKDILKISFALFVLFFSIAFLFPYTGDDWTWGSDAGLEYLETFFADYNGRYLGNLLVLTLTRSKLLDALVMALSYVLVCFCCYEYAEEKNKTLLWLAAVLFFIMPKEIWAQTIVWTSGFSNYVPSALITAAFLFSVRKVLDKGLTNSGRNLGKSTVMFVMGFCGALFVENVTVFHIGFAAITVIYTFLRLKKNIGEHLSFLIGAIAGACVMFSNSAYHKILRGDDYYRYTPESIGESIEMIMEHARDILTYIIYDNLLFCGIVTILLMILGEIWNTSKEKKVCSDRIPSVFHFCCFLMVLCKDSVICILEQWTVLSQRMELLFEIGVALLYVLSIVALIMRYVESGRKIKMILPLCCVVGSLAPLLVVNPIGPRCVFIGYFFMMIFAVDLAGYLRRKIIPEEQWLCKLVCLISVMQALMFVNIYYPVHCYDVLRSDFIQKQVQTGKKSVLICELPSNEYLWNSNPTGEGLSRRYRQFYKLDEDIQFDFIPYDELKVLSEAHK